MESENKKSEQADAKSGGDHAGKSEWMQGQVGEIIKLINQPAIASALAGLGLYFAIDPKEIKNALRAIEKKINEMAEVIDQQSEAINSLEKQLKMRRPRFDDDSREQDNNLNGYRKARRHARSFHLD